MHASWAQSCCLRIRRCAAAVTVVVVPTTGMRPKMIHRFLAQSVPRKCTSKYLERAGCLLMASLLDAVRNTLRSCYPRRLTSAQVRDELRLAGFDFSSYDSGPLPSVSTTLRRLKESGEATREDSKGVASYQANLPERSLLQNQRAMMGSCDARDAP